MTALLLRWKRSPGRSTRVVLATAHLDHDPFNHVPENLVALCQRCHILHDKAEHLRRRRLIHLSWRALRAERDRIAEELAHCRRPWLIRVLSAFLERTPTKRSPF